MQYLLDTNILLLLVVGAADERLVEKHKRTSGRFRADHYVKLLELVGETEGISTTSNVLTEVSNLAAQVGEPIRTQVMQSLAALVGVCVEVHVPGRLAMNDPSFIRLGLTDALLLKLEKEQHHLLSVDGPLCYACHEVGLPCTNLTPYFFAEA